MSYKLVDSEMIHEGFLSLQIDTLQRADNMSIFYHIILTGRDAVVVVAVDEEKNYIINLEYRHPIKKTILSCPGGGIEKGEDPLSAGSRELLEETGYFSDQIFYLAVSYPLPAICDQKIFFILAKDATKIQSPHRDPFERIQTKLFSEEDLKKKIFSVEEVDGILCSALFYYQNWDKKNV